MEEERVRRYKETLGRYLPQGTVEPLFVFLTQTNSVRLHITRERRTKLGDYRWPQPGHAFHEISVNGDLNPYLFLWVLLHEMAHLNTHKRYRNGVQAHGHEWQEQYALLLREYLHHFPAEVQGEIGRLTARIPLNRSLNRSIEASLKRYDPGYNAAEALPMLAELPLGTTFSLEGKPEMVFRSLEKRRTRFRCVEVHTNREFLVAGRAPVVVVE